MIPPQVIIGGGVLLGKAAQWLFGGGGSSGGYGNGGAVASGHGDDGCIEGWLPDNDRFKWLGVPARSAHRVRLGPDIWTCEQFMEMAEKELRKADRRGEYEKAEAIAYTIGYVRGTRKELTAAGYVTFIVEVI